MAFETIDQVVKAKSENSSINYKFVGHCVEISRICSDTPYIFFFTKVRESIFTSQKSWFHEKRYSEREFLVFPHYVGSTQNL